MQMGEGGGGLGCTTGHMWRYCAGYDNEKGPDYRTGP